VAARGGGAGAWPGETALGRRPWWLSDCHNVTVDAGVRSLVTLTTLSDLNVAPCSPAKSLVTLTPLSVVNVTRRVL
jgi:hypothetical protein